MKESHETKSTPSLGNRTASGFVWLTGQTLVVKAMTMLGQLVLSWLLLPQDFGLISLAYTVVALTGILQQHGIKEILVRRHNHFNGWATPAFWVSALSGSGAGLVIAMAAPLGLWLYGDSRVVGLILILAIAAPLGALMTVPNAKLQIQLRFRAMAMMGILDGIGTMLLTILLAYRGFGAYSFAIPRPIMALVENIVLWMIAGQKLHSTLQIKRWKFLMLDSGMLVGAWFFQGVMSQEDYAVLGLFHSKLVVGIYYFAFNLSLQTLALFTGSLVGVVLPAFARLQADPEKQVDAFYRATRMLAFFGVPLCLLQSAVASPLIRLMFPERYLTAIPVLQILSIGMTFMMVSGPSHSLFQAQGRFKALFIFNFWYALCYLIVVVIGALVGAEISVAIAASACIAIVEPVRIFCAMAPARRPWRDVAKIFAAPLFMSAVALGAGLLAGFAVTGWGGAQTRLRDAINIATTATVAGGVYLLLARFFLSDLLGELVGRVRALFKH